MKKLLIIALIAGLGFASCSKLESDSTDLDAVETFVFNGEKLSISDSKVKIGLILGVNPEQFVFMPDSLGFKWNRPGSNNTIILYVKDYVSVMKGIEL